MKQTSNTLGKSKILFILHLPPPVHGAAMVGKYIHDSASVNSEFDCHYINLTTASSLEDIGQVGWHKVKAFFHLLQEIRQSVKELKPDLVYVTPNAMGGPFYKDFVVVQVLKSLGCKIVVHYHNKGVRTRQNNWFDHLLYKKFFKGIKVILLGLPLYKDVEKYVKEEDAYICPNGIPDLEENLLVERCNDIPHILWLTNIMKTKGVLDYLDALQLLKERGVAFKADFVGGLTVEMNEDEFDKALIAHGLMDCSYYAGKKYGSEKEDYYRKADIFVLPSYTEAFPLTILEAMCWGLPVVASNVGGISAEVVDGETGFLIGGKVPIMDNMFRPDALELADKIETLLTDKELRARMGKAGKLKFQKEFSLEAFEKRFVEILSQVSTNS